MTCFLINNTVIKCPIKDDMFALSSVFNNTKFKSALDLNKIYLPETGFVSLLNYQADEFIFIKDKQFRYQHANSNFIDLMGIKNFKNLYNQTNYAFYDDLEKIRLYQQHDEEVFETGKSLFLEADVSPRNNLLINKYMQGNLYPVYSSQNSNPIAVMGIVKAQHQPFKLSLENAVSLTLEEFNNYFTKRSYYVEAYGRKIVLSRREIQCIIELLKGKHAGEIAEYLMLKQSTIEFYLTNIKNKLGADTRSSLIMTILNQKIIQQIIL